MTTSSRCGLLDLMVNPVSDNPMGRARDQAGWWDQGRHAGLPLPCPGGMKAVLTE